LAKATGVPVAFVVPVGVESRSPFFPEKAMLQSRVDVVQDNLRRYLEDAVPRSPRRNADQPLRDGSSLTCRAAIALFQDQVLSRLLDVMSRELKERNQSYYTIASAGHEQNATVGAQLRLTDPCLLHYRSGGLMMARSRKDSTVDPVLDTLLSFAAGREDPMSGGRHKVWGSLRLQVPPQTSTIASHLPKAMGLAFAIGRRKKLGLTQRLPEDSIVLCSFGDASASHAAAMAGINGARYAFRRGNPVPILFLCEDNRVGISVTKPRRWIADSYSGLSQLEYFAVQSGELVEIWDTVEKAINVCRTRRKPVFLRIPMVRLWGHAGSDVETTYRSLEEIERMESQDPLLANARLLVESGAASPRELLGILEATRRRVEQTAAHVVTRPRLTTAEEVMAPLAPLDLPAARESVGAPADPERRNEIFRGRLPENATAPTKRSMAALINAALHDEMIRRPELVAFGEDVAKKGGVYYVTAGLQERFGTTRVFDTLLDETTILGLAQGLAHHGLLPIPEIQYLAYLHNAIDQLRSEACSLQFFSNDQFRNPMVVRIAAFAYQRGFGGHFHNDNAIGALREIPGLLLASPSRGDDAVRLLRGMVALAATSGRVGCFLEPIALYHQKDLHEEGDQAWLFDYPGPGEADSAIFPGEVGIYQSGNTDLLLVSYANGVRLSLRAARALEDECGLKCRVLDLRWLNPLPLDAVLAHASECDAVLVVDECRATGAGIADAVIAGLAESGTSQRLASVRARDTYIPLGPAANTVLVQEADIVAKARELSGV
jgi:2-oxoisovalerate dehydrogenase E1 component